MDKSAIDIIKLDRVAISFSNNDITVQSQFFFSLSAHCVHWYLPNTNNNYHCRAIFRVVWVYIFPFEYCKQQWCSIYIIISNHKLLIVGNMIITVFKDITRKCNISMHLQITHLAVGNVYLSMQGRSIVCYM